MARRRHSAMQQALQEAQLTYGPQRRDLQSTLTDAGRTRQNDVRAAQVSGGALAHQIRQSLGPLSQDYRLAARVGDVNNNDVLRALAGQSGVGGYLATIRSDRALNSTLGARELANAKGSLRLQANQALQGAVNDVANVRSNYQSLAGKIKSQLAGLTADQAKYVAVNAPKIAASMAADARAARAAADAHRAAQDTHRNQVQKRWLTSPVGGGLLDSVASAFGGKGGIGATVGKLHAGPHLTGPQSGSALSQINQAVAAMQQARHAGQHVDPTYFLTGYRGKKGEVSIPKLGNAGPIRNSVLVKAALDIDRYNRLTQESYDALYGVQGIPRAWRPPGPRMRRASRSAARQYLPGANLIYR